MIISSTSNNSKIIIGHDKNGNVNYRSDGNNTYKREVFDFDSNGATDYERMWMDGEIREEQFFNNDPDNNEVYALTLGEDTVCRSSGHNFFKNFLEVLTLGLYNPHKNCEDNMQKTREQADNFDDKTTKYVFH